MVLCYIESGLRKKRDRERQKGVPVRTCSTAPWPQLQDGNPELFPSDPLQHFRDFFIDIFHGADEPRAYSPLPVHDESRRRPRNLQNLAREATIVEQDRKGRFLFLHDVAHLDEQALDLETEEPEAELLFPQEEAFELRKLRNAGHSSGAQGVKHDLRALELR